MESLLLPILYLVGVLYGLITFFKEMKKRPNASKNYLGLSVAIVVCCGTAFIMTVG
ncbi:hypothetical protein [Planococcus sp. CAU13]|uniref:hypothetical protein n=1 Tax=Planococcus sp. CAU13 TaxID=1541197 RepID=UPI00137666A9|nr:hypothetical protein [Planococcus sp. CAU13]